MIEEDGLLTVNEAAKVLRIARQTAYSMVNSGELPSIRLRRVIRVPRAAIKRLLGTVEMKGGVI